MHEALSDELLRYDDEWESTDVTEEEYGAVPDGLYRVRVEEVCLKNSQSGNLMLAWQLEIVGQEHGGRKLFKNSLLVTPKNRKWLKIDLDKCGLKLEKLSQLPGRLSELLDLILEVRKVTKGEFENIYIQKRIERIESGEIAATITSAVDEPDVIPF